MVMGVTKYTDYYNSHIDLMFLVLLDTTATLIHTLCDNATLETMTWHEAELILAQT